MTTKMTAAERRQRDETFARDWADAMEAGSEAGDRAFDEAQPVALVEATVTGAVRPGGREFTMPHGLCGFAWVHVPNAGSAFGRWVKKHHGARTGYPSGLNWSVRQYGQCYEAKVAFADAAADLLRARGYKVWSGDRLD